MTFPYRLQRCVGFAVIASVLLGSSMAGQGSSTQELPAEVQGIKVFRIPLEPGESLESPLLYRKITFESIDFDRLRLNLFVSLRPVDRAVTVKKVYFQNVTAGGIPLRVEPFEKPFKLSKQHVVDLPEPLQVSVNFSDIRSLAPVLKMMEAESLPVAGEGFVVVKLNLVEKMALRAGQVVIPTALDDEIPLQLFTSSLVEMGAKRILETLSAPDSPAALTLARQYVEKEAQKEKLRAVGEGSVFLVYCEYVLRDPKRNVEETFTQSGTSFLVRADGRLLTAKRVVEPWKFDPPIRFLMQRYGLELVRESYRRYAWPAGARVLDEQRQLRRLTGHSLTEGTLRVLSLGRDRMVKVLYQDEDTEEKAEISLHVGGEADLAVLQLGGRNFAPLIPVAGEGELSPDAPVSLYGFPFGASQSISKPHPASVKVSRDGKLLTLDRQLNPGEFGAPLLTPEGRVLCIATGGRICVPIQLAQNILN